MRPRASQKCRVPFLTIEVSAAMRMGEREKAAAPTRLRARVMLFIILIGLGGVESAISQAQLQKTQPHGGMTSRRAQAEWQ